MTTTRYADFRLAVRRGLGDWVPDVVHGAADELRSPALRNAVAGDRNQAAPVLALLHSRGGAFAAALQRALGELMDEDTAAARHAGPRSGPATLSLVAEDQIDEDIEVARIISAIDAEAELELQRLARLCSALLQHDAIGLDAIPLNPGLCARALRRCLDGFELERPARLLLMRVVGAVMGKRLKPIYAEQADALTRHDVRPLGYRIVRDPSGAMAAGAPPGAARPAQRNETIAGPVTHRRPSAALERLLAWARDAGDAELPGSDRNPDAGEPMLRLRLDALPPGRSPSAPPLAPDTAARTMDRLLEQIGHQSALSGAARELLQRLREPARDLAARDAQLWSGLDHPWWLLLDRIIAAGTLGGSSDANVPSNADRAMQQMAQRLVASGRIDRRRCETALAEASRAAALSTPELTLEQSSQVKELQSQVEREDLEFTLRNQLVRQLRQTPAPAGVRQFLLGPWVLAMREVSLELGATSPALAAMAEAVDDLLHATGAGAPPAAPARRAGLLQRLRQGLARARLPAARIEAELKDLAAVLANPGPAAIEPAQDAPATLPMPVAPGSHAALPTVPIDMYETHEATAASRDRQAWLDSLSRGTVCHLFLGGAWTTATLSWVSPNRNVFVFASGRGGQLHSMTRRVLEKARGAGLAATMEQGGLLAQAMDALTDAAPLGG